ncbi:MAG: hypothetical protein K0R17_952, partial [Rariglobus sp.]|nr:hypothetical protein [Rariglobus sp.]
MGCITSLQHFAIICVNSLRGCCRSLSRHVFMSLIFNFVREARAFAAIIHSVILGIVFLSSLAASAVLAAVDESYVSRDGLHLWLNADALARDPITQLGLDSGDAVAQWPDSSGLGNHAVQPTSANRPTFIASSLNGRAVVRFSAASKHYLSVATPWFNPPTLTLVVVAKRTSGTGLAMVADKYNGSTTYGITFNSASVCAAYINN